MENVLKDFMAYTLRSHQGKVGLVHPYCGNTIHMFSGHTSLDFDLEQAHTKIMKHREECVMYT